MKHFIYHKSYLITGKKKIVEDEEYFNIWDEKEWFALISKIPTEVHEEPIIEEPKKRGRKKESEDMNLKMILGNK